MDLVVADFNVDHKPDVAVLVHDANDGTSRVLLLAGKGDGTFQALNQTPVVLNTAIGSNGKYLVAADFNNDINPDLAVQVSGGVAILLGQGDGTFQAGATLAVAGGLAVSDLKAGDFNGDGKVSLLTRSEAPNTSCGNSTSQKGGIVARIGLWVGNGDGSFQAEQALDNAQSCPISTGEGLGLQGSAIGVPSLGDFNGDGRLDLEYEISKFSRAKADENVAAMRLGRKDKAFSMPLPVKTLGIPVPSGAGLVARDLNGDKLSDLVYLDGDNNAVLVLLNTSPSSGADLGIAKAAAGQSLLDSPSSWYPADGRSFFYGAQILNEGPQDATGVKFTATLPAGVTLVSVTATQGSCNQSGGTVSCAIDSLATGFGTTISIAVTLKPTATEATLTANIKVTANEPDLSLTNNVAAPSAAAFVLTISTDGTGTGIVTSMPAGISCTATCSQRYLENSTVTLTSTPAPGSVFTGWDGSTSGGVDNVAMASSQTVRATFDEAPDAPRLSGTGGGGTCTWWDLYAMLLLWLSRMLSAKPFRACAPAR